MSEPRMWWRANLEAGAGRVLDEKAFLDWAQSVQRTHAAAATHTTHLLPPQALRDPGEYVCIDCGTLIDTRRIACG